MRKSVKILLLISILSCSNEKKNETALFNEITFKINEGESIGIINSKIKNKYTDNFNNNLIQIPLFKYIKHADYEIFIGIPYNTSIQELVQYQLEKKDRIIANLNSDSLSHFIKYKRNNFYIAEYVAKVASNSLIYIYTMSISKELTDSLFNKSELSSRIKTYN